MIKTLVINLPPMEQSRPPLSGAILANICQQQGHTCHVINLQVQLDKFLKQYDIDQELFNDVFYENSRSFDKRQIDLLHKFIELELNAIKKEKYDYVLVSLFSYLGQSFGEIFLPQLRQATQGKIVIGGAGIIKVDNIGNKLGFAERMKSNQVIDEYIVGEAEEILPVYFRGESGPGIGNQNFKQIDDLDIQPWPDYSFYDLADYPSSREKELIVIGSRGCVRSCTFCDVAVTSPKYRYRSGQNIANEIIHHYETHGVTSYYFADSLINGSFKAFDEMCNALARYKFDQPIKWSGQYIIRNKSTTPKNHFEMLKNSGCQMLFVGIESGCDRVRFELGKKFTNDDIEYYLENFEQFGIQILFLFFTGYVSETEQDYAETLQMFKRWQRYVATGTIQGIETLQLLLILPGTKLEKLAIENNFLFLSDQNNKVDLRSWINPAHPNFDFKQRVWRHVNMMEEAMKYKWPLWNGGLSMRLYEQSITKFMNNSKNYLPLKSI